MNKDTNIIALLKEKAGILILCGFLVASLSFLFFVVIEKNFKVSTEYLVIQNQSETRDLYYTSKSAEYIGKIMSRAVYSELFIDEVINTGKVDSEFLPFNKKDKIKAWKKMVDVKRDFQLGIIQVEVFSNSQNDASAISEAIAEVMTQKNELFRGEGQGINIRILSGPIVEKNPDVSKIFSVMVVGFVLGTLLCFVRIYYKKEYGLDMTLENEIEKIKNREGDISISPQEYEESLDFLDEN